MRASALVGTFGACGAAELLRVLAAPAAARCDLVELRLDYLADPLAALPDLIAASPVPVVATCRRPCDGGAFAGDEAERLGLLAQAAALGAAWVDVERDVERLPALAGARLLRSAHVERLPPAPAELVARLLAPPAAAGKLVALEGDEGDAVRLLESIDEHAGRLAGHVVAQRFTRFAGPALGAPLVYAALRRGGRIGLSLPTVAEFLDGAALHRVRRGTRLFVLLGSDVEQSVGPQMLNDAFEALDEDVVALRWSCVDPRPALEALLRFRWAGAAVTIPHKETALAAVLAGGGRATDVAEEIGAVNTVVVRDGRLVAHNTDLGGLLAALSDPLAGREVAGRAALVLGAGGAARAAVCAAYRLGCRPVVFARRPAAARSLAALARAGDAPLEIATDARAAAAAEPALVLDATPAGPPGGRPFFDPALLTQPAVVLDMLVAPRPTALLAAAERAGHATVPGLSMLVRQAVLQVEAVLEGGTTGDDAERRTLLTATMTRRASALLAARRMPVVLLGLRCSGKTTVGARLAQLTGRVLLDVDAEVTRRVGRTPDELIAAGREPEFRDVEAQVMTDACGTAAVVATGGGAALSPEALQGLCDRAALVVLLDAPDAVLLERLAAVPRAPLSDLAAADELARQRHERSGRYREVADTVVDTSRLSVDEIAGELATRLPCC